MAVNKKATVRAAFAPIPEELREVELREARGCDGLHYDYDLQCWVQGGHVKRCGHRERMQGCYACEHVDEEVRERRAT